MATVVGGEPDDLPYGRRGARLALVGTDHETAAVAAMVTDAGLHIAYRTSWRQPDAANIPALDLALFDLRHAHDTAADDLSRWLDLCAEREITPVLWTDLESIDGLFGVFEERGEIVLEDDRDELIATLLRVAPVEGHLAMFEERKPFDHAQLGQIGERLAEFASTLTRMAESDDAGSGSPDDDAPAAQFHASPSQQLAELRTILEQRRLREKFFDAALFADPAWDMLLDLMIARLEGQRVSVSSLCIAACVPPTTALRWITKMTEVGLFEREEDPADARRIYIHLAREPAAAMTAYLAARRAIEQPQS